MSFAVFHPAVTRWFRAVLQTVYPRVGQQRCWVHKMRNLLEKVRKRDYDQVQAATQALYLARSRGQAQNACERFRRQWQSVYPALVRRLERDLPELFTFFEFPRRLWRKLRTTNVIERCLVEVRRRPRPLVCFVNVPSVDRIVFAILNRMNPQWKTAPPTRLHKPLDSTIRYAALSRVPEVDRIHRLSGFAQHSECGGDSGTLTRGESGFLQEVLWQPSSIWRS